MIYYIAFNPETSLWEYRRQGNPLDELLGEFPTEASALNALRADEPWESCWNRLPWPHLWRYSDDPDAAELARRGFQIIQI